MTGAEPIKAAYADGCLTVTPVCEVDHHSAPALREKTDHQLYLYHPRKFVLMLDRVSFMDSSGLGLILGRLAVCRTLGCPMHLRGADERMMKIFRLAGLERIEGLTIEGLKKKGAGAK